MSIKKNLRNLYTSKKNLRNQWRIKTHLWRGSQPSPNHNCRKYRVPLIQIHRLRPRLRYRIRKRLDLILQRNRRKMCGIAGVKNHRKTLKRRRRARDGAAIKKVSGHWKINRKRFMGIQMGLSCPRSRSEIKLKFEF